MIKRLAAMEIGWKLGVGFVLTYLIFHNTRYYWDGVDYAQLAERAVDWRETLHPHHLFYNLFVMWVTRLVATPLGFAHPGLIAQQTIGAVAGGLGVMFAYRSLKYLMTDPLAWQCALLLGVAFTWWSFAGDHGPYTFAVSRLIFCFYIVVQGYRDAAFEPKKLIMGGIHLFLAVMFHQAAALMIVPWVVVLWDLTKDAEKRVVYRVVPLCTSVGLIVFHYLLFGFVSLKLGTLSAVIAWAMGYGGDSRWWYLANNPWWMLPWAIVKSHVATFIYPDYTLAGLFRIDTANLGLDLAKKVLVLWALRHLVVAFVGGLQHAGYFLSLQPKALRFYLIWWVAAYFLFFGFFQPQQAFYRLFYILPLVMLIGVGFERGWRIAGQSLTAHPIGLLIPLTLFNLGAGILPQGDASKNPWLMRARELVAAIPQRTVVVLPGDAAFSVSDDINATRTWELVEYLGGVLPGPDRANAIEVVYADTPSRGPALRSISVPELLASQQGMESYDHLLMLTRGTYELTDRTFAWKSLRIALQRWEHRVRLEGNVQPVEYGGISFLEMTRPARRDDQTSPE